jgi:nitrate reductase gamma subunit
MYELVRGPLALISFIVFLAGIVYQVFWFFKNTKKQEPAKIYGVLPSKKEIMALAPSEDIKRLARWEGSGWSMEPTFVILTSIFHILAILTPIFLLAHNILIEESWGIFPPSFSEKFSDILTIVILGFGAYFLYRRLFSPKIKAITSSADFFMFLIVFVPYLTGFLAYHQIFPYKTMIIIHMLSGEIMLVCIPFSKLRHMIFFFLNRFFIKSEYSFFKMGTRVWS